MKKVFQPLLISLLLHGLLLASLMFQSPLSEERPLTLDMQIHEQADKPTPPARKKTAESSPLKKMESDLSQTFTNPVSLSESERYLYQVQSRIRAHQSYPSLSRKRREEGLVRLRVELHRDGSLHDLEIVEASPFERLNRAAKNAILKAAPFAPFPDEVEAVSWSIHVPIRFQLRSN